MRKYNHQKIEKKWQKKWLEEGIYEPDLKKAKRPFYNLMMFPYPSAEGLHIGNVYAFVGSDIYGRFMRMQGRNVFEPIGLDGFGIHSENYALSIGQHPAKLAKRTEKNFYRQLQMIGNGFAWNERLETYDPEYYKWTQWVFVQMFKHGLAYRKKAEVNWCPSCKTVLADEQVISGECERCKAKVIHKELEQWFFKITKYAERLLKDLDKIDWSEKVKIAQRNWIGKSEGTIIRFNVKCQMPNVKIDVFTTRVDTIFGCTYVVVAPEHEIISNLKSQISNLQEVEKYVKRAKEKSDLERTDLAKEKTGVELKGIKAVNPFNNDAVPIFVADYVLAGYGTGAIMAVPAHDERDWEFAKKYNLPVKQVIIPAKSKAQISNVKSNPKFKSQIKVFVEDGILVNSGEFTGLTSAAARNEMAKWLSQKKIGGRKTSYRLRDWLISRQRYWGPPIPMIKCKKCGWQPVPEKDLPVKLPFIKDFKPLGKGESPLASVEKFYKVKCPKCKGEACRETDVSDTFLDSAWYYFRYPSLNSKNTKLPVSSFHDRDQMIRGKKKGEGYLELPWNKEIIDKWLPVDMYIGGAEHAVLHLLYTRFITKVFYDWGLINFDEPFEKFRAHGLIIKDGAKMSKSRGNIVIPDEYIKVFGADALRMYLMFLGPFANGGDFRDSGIAGITRFLNRAYKLKSKIQNPKSKTTCKSQISNKNLEKLLHQSIKKVTEDIERLQYNTAISQLMILVNEMEKQPAISLKDYKTLLLLLAPFAPHITEELWQSLRNLIRNKLRNSTFKSIHLQSWPKYDSKKIEEEAFELVVQINGKVRDSFQVPMDISKKRAISLTLERKNVMSRIEGREIKKIIFVPKKLINIVV